MPAKKKTIVAKEQGTEEAPSAAVVPSVEGVPGADVAPSVAVVAPPPTPIMPVAATGRAPEDTSMPPQEYLDKVREYNAALAKNIQVFWGIDSANYAYSIVFTGETIFDYVSRVSGRKPSYWGRYLGDYQMTPEEIVYIHSKNTSILPVYNGFTEYNIQWGYDTGVSHAKRAIAIAESLKIPHSVCIYADVEATWWPNPDLIGGWSDVFRNSAYFGAGGFYANPVDPGFSYAYNNAYNRYRSMQGTPVSYVWSNEPEPGQILPPPSWDPYWPDANAPGTHLWQYRENVLGQDLFSNVDLNLCTKEALEAMFHPHITGHILHTAALKPDATHESKSMKTLFGGIMVVITGHEQTTKGEVWSQVSVANLTGYVLKTNLFNITIV